MNTNLRIFDGATAIITGAASGIGAAMAIEFSSRGCTVVLADRQIELAKEVADRINSSGGSAWAREVDVTDYSSVEKLVKETVEKTGRIDYMLNNAGIGIGGPVEDYTLGDWDQTIDVNIRGVTNGIHAVYPIMISQGFGHIVNTASMAGLIPAPGSVAYSASKFAVAGLSQALGVEAEQHGIRVSVLCPGAIRTPILVGGKYGKLPEGLTPEKATEFWNRLRPIMPDIFARQAANQIASNKLIIIIPGWWRALWWAYRLSWQLWFGTMKKRYVETLKEMLEDTP